jgi:hypothetical protein
MVMMSVRRRRTEARNPPGWPLAARSRRMPRAWTVLLQLLVVVCSVQRVPAVAASHGDSSPQFADCEERCVLKGCASTARTLLLFPWSCRAECRYTCMHQIEAEHRGRRPVYQYFGKWPFVRFLGVQEPLSTAFSFLNGCPHALWLLRRGNRVRYALPDDLPVVRNMLLFSSAVGVNTWIWSTAFHARDNWWTERLDYHFATLHMATFLWVALVRLQAQLDPSKTMLTAASTGAVLGLWLMRWVPWPSLPPAIHARRARRHVYWLNAVHFDYGYNMLATGAVVGLQVLAWLVWALVARSQGAAHWSMVCKFQLCLVCFALLEAFDFPPLWGWLDAHAAWHGLTVPLVVYWCVLGDGGGWVDGALDGRAG